jgi:hypothetical protein
LKNDRDQKNLFIKCSCYSEILYLEHDMEDKTTFLSMFRTDASFSKSLWQRLRACFQILKYGRPYADQIVLSIDDVKKMKTYFAEVINSHNVDVELDLDENTLVQLALESAKRNITVSEFVEEVLRKEIEREEANGTQPINS